MIKHNSTFKNAISEAPFIWGALLLISCANDIETPTSTEYLDDFHTFTINQKQETLQEDSLALYVDYSTCIAQGQHSDFYKSLVPSWVDATRKYFSIKGKEIKQENLKDSTTYTRLLSVEEVNYADLKTAANMIANGNTEGVLLTDGEYYNPTIENANANNPYMADALKKWLKKGHDVFVIAEPYEEQNNGLLYHKSRFYFIFTDTRLKNNVYDRICQTTSDFKNFPEINIFHLSADHPNILSSGTTAGISSEANPSLAASITPGNKYEIQDWTVTWDVINNSILGATDPQTGQPLPMGDYVIRNLSIDRLSFGGYVIEDVDIKVSDLNEAYTNFYKSCVAKTKPEPIQSLPECHNFMMLDKNELKKGGNLKVHFDIMNFTPTFLIAENNYFKIDFYITKTRNAFQNIEQWFTFDLLGKPNQPNMSVVESIKQCLTDADLQNQMKESPFYTIYVKCNKY